MNKNILIALLVMLALISCRNKYYDTDDFSSVKKIDSHIHIGSDDGVFEDQAAADKEQNYIPLFDRGQGP